MISMMRTDVGFVLYPFIAPLAWLLWLAYRRLEKALRRRRYR